MSKGKYYYPDSTQLTALPTAPTLSASAGGNLGNGNYIYAVSYVLSQGESMVGNLTTATSSGGANTKFTLTNISTGPSYCLARKIYRTEVGGTTLKACAYINDNTTTSYVDTLADASLGSTYSQTSNSIDPSLNANGVLNVNAFVYQTSSSVSAAVGTANITCNSNLCMITITGNTAVEDANTSRVVTNYYVTSNSSVIATVNSYSGTVGNNGIPVITITNISTGKFTLNITNAGSNALSGDLVIACQVIN